MINQMTKPIFRKLDAEVFNKNKDGIVHARVTFYGKPQKIEILSKDIVRYQAHLISRRLELKNGKYANIMRKLINSCIANGEQRGINRGDLFIRSVTVGRGSYLKRREFKGRGRSGAIWRPFANVLLELQGVNFGQR